MSGVNQVCVLLLYTGVGVGSGVEDRVLVKVLDSWLFVEFLESRDRVTLSLFVKNLPKAAEVAFIYEEGDSSTLHLLLHVDFHSPSCSSPFAPGKRPPSKVKESFPTRVTQGVRAFPPLRLLLQ